MKRATRCLLQLSPASRRSSGAPAIFTRFAGRAARRQTDPARKLTLPGSNERYLTSSGAVLTKSYVIWSQQPVHDSVDHEELPGLGKALANAAVSATVTASLDFVNESLNHDTSAQKVRRTRHTKPSARFAILPARAERSIGGLPYRYVDDPFTPSLVTADVPVSHGPGPVSRVVLWSSLLPITRERPLRSF